MAEALEATQRGVNHAVTSKRGLWWTKSMAHPTSKSGCPIIREPAICYAQYPPTVLLKLNIYSCRTNARTPLIITEDWPAGSDRTVCGFASPQKRTIIQLVRHVHSVITQLSFYFRLLLKCATNELKWNINSKNFYVQFVPLNLVSELKAQEF